MRLMKRVISPTVALATTTLALAAIASRPLVNPDITARAQASEQVRELPMSLRGNPSVATLNYTGTLEASDDGRLVGRTERFKPTQIKTSKNPGKWLKVVSFSIGKDGFLVVQDESRTSYRITVAPMGSTGTIKELSWRPPVGAR